MVRKIARRDRGPCSANRSSHAHRRRASKCGHLQTGLGASRRLRTDSDGATSWALTAPNTTRHHRRTDNTGRIREGMRRLRLGGPCRRRGYSRRDAGAFRTHPRLAPRQVVNFYGGNGKQSQLPRMKTSTELGHLRHQILFASGRNRRVNSVQRRDHRELPPGINFGGSSLTRQPPASTSQNRQQGTEATLAPSITDSRPNAPPATNRHLTGRRSQNTTSFEGRRGTTDLSSISSASSPANTGAGTARRHRHYPDTAASIVVGAQRRGRGRTGSRLDSRTSGLLKLASPGVGLDPEFSAGEEDEHSLPRHNHRGAFPGTRHQGCGRATQFAWNAIRDRCKSSTKPGRHRSGPPSSCSGFHGMDGRYGSWMFGRGTGDVPQTPLANLPRTLQISLRLGPPQSGSQLR